jgi:hypothetical protein
VLCANDHLTSSSDRRSIVINHAIFSIGLDFPRGDQNFEALGEHYYSNVFFLRFWTPDNHCVYILSQDVQNVVRFDSSVREIDKSRRENKKSTSIRDVPSL